MVFFNLDRALAYVRFHEGYYDLSLTPTPHINITPTMQTIHPLYLGSPFRKMTATHNLHQTQETDRHCCAAADNRRRGPFISRPFIALVLHSRLGRTGFTIRIRGLLKGFISMDVLVEA
jgi:hypothetical protein